MANPKILFITTQLPYPPTSGGTIKSWRYVKDLSERYTIAIASLLKDNDSQNVEEFKRVIELDDLIVTSQKVERSPLSLIKSYFGYPCLNVFRNYSKDFQKQILAISGNYDAIIIDHYEMFQYVPKQYKGKIIMHTHNAEFLLWKRMSELSNNPIIKLLLKLESLRVKNYERKIFNASDMVYSTPSDMDTYRKNGFDISKHKYTYHLGKDELLNLPNLSFKKGESAICFMGTLSWEPNIDGLIWFIEKVWPIIIQEIPRAKLYILGKKGDNRIYNAAQAYNNIIFTGFVKDVDAYLKKAKVYIAPLRFGSGMKVKVLEGLYRGIPMVSTSVGAEGLKLIDRKHILIANTPQSFAKACIQLIYNKPLWEKLRDNSRKIAKEEYRWSPLFEKMDIELKRLMKKSDI